jgi:hypothetical protein
LKGKKKIGAMFFGVHIKKGSVVTLPFKFLFLKIIIRMFCCCLVRRYYRALHWITQ